MSDKLKILAKNFSQITPSDFTWEHMIDLRKRYADYLQNRDVTFILNLFLMILSLKRTGGFDMYEKIRNNVFLIGILENTGEAFTYWCNECNGDGHVDCENCGGSGNETCSQCDGDGTERCFECSGDGEVIGDEGPEECGECVGEGEIDCGECGGDGSVTCSDCGGNGSQDCQNCDGQGEIESDTRTMIETKLYLSWNKDLANLAELRVGTEDPIDLNYSGEDLILVGTDEGNGEPMDFVEEGETYIYYFSDDLEDIWFNRKSSHDGRLITTKGIGNYIEDYEYS